MNTPTSEQFHGLSIQQIQMLKNILMPFAQNIEQVDLFGSRAMGNFKLNSDIDLVLRGNVSQEFVDRLWSVFS